MKKLYVLLMLLPFMGIKAQSVPTCSIDPSYTTEGIHPDSAQGFANGTVGQPYYQNVTVVIPLDTTVSGFTCTYSTIDLTNTNYNLPPGLSLTGTPSNYHFPGNAKSCMAIYGTPTTAGTYSLNFVLSVYCTSTGPVAVTTYTVGYYHITIAAATGIETNNVNNSSFGVMQNNPNPITNATTNIKLSIPADGKAKMTVYNITGQKMIDKEFTVQRGENNYEFDATTLENGIYLYSIEFNGQKQVRRMVVAK